MNTPAHSLHQLRLQYQPKLPPILENLGQLVTLAVDDPSVNDEELLLKFKHTYRQSTVSFIEGEQIKTGPLRIGVVFSGGQASGGHNVVSGLFDALKKLNKANKLFGFLNGPSGILKNQQIELSETLIAQYRNQGGFDLLGSGRTKIETLEQFAAAEKTMLNLNLDGLVIVGGDDSNTNAALLAEYFADKKIKTRVIGVPKTIDGDLKNSKVEISFGFDTATKTFSDIIGNVQRDALSAKKYYFFIKMMGRTASHITLECALQTHPNAALISEEIAAQNKTLATIITELSNLICQRFEMDKEYGVILLPEGLLEFIPECKILIQELNSLLSPNQQHLREIERLNAREQKINYVSNLLTAESKACFTSLPSEIQLQLLLDRDPHGNVQVSKIETERLLIEMIKQELKQRKKDGKYEGKFNPQPLFCGYEGRSCYPSNFDANYCYALGHVAALLIQNGKSGYMAAIQHLASNVEEWVPAGIPLVSMMSMEHRHGIAKPVIQKSMVDLEGKPFAIFKDKRSEWAVEDHYNYPGPIQYFGPEELTDSITSTLRLETGDHFRKELNRRETEYSRRY